MSLPRRALWIALPAVAACGVVAVLAWTAGGSPATPRPELPAGEVPEVDTALFAVG